MPPRIARPRRGLAAEGAPRAGASPGSPFPSHALACVSLKVTRWQWKDQDVLRAGSVQSPDALVSDGGGVLLASEEPQAQGQGFRAVGMPWGLQPLALKVGVRPVSLHSMQSSVKPTAAGRPHGSSATRLRRASLTDFMPGVELFHKRAQTWEFGSFKRGPLAAFEYSTPTFSVYLTLSPKAPFLLARSQ